MLRRGLVEGAHLLEYFAAIEPSTYRYPAIDQEAFRQTVLDAVKDR